MEKKPRYKLLIGFSIFKLVVLYIVSIVFLLQFNNSMLTLLFAAAIIFSTFTQEYNKNSIEIRKGKKKNNKNIGIILEFIPDILLLLFSLFYLYFARKIGISWLNCAILFILIWFLKSTVFELVKYIRKYKKI